MESFREKSGNPGGNRLVREHIRTEFSQNDTYLAPTLAGAEEKLTAKICDLTPPIDQEGKEIVVVEAGMEEIERAEPEFNTTGIVLKTKKERPRRSYRRRKVRVYFP